MKLNTKEKQSIREALATMSKGTELQDHAEFVSDYIGIYVISLVENRDDIFLPNQCAKCGAKKPECVGSMETITYYPICAKCSGKESHVGKA